jgi:hypothetical protein
MDLEIKFSPTNVSFYRVQILEVPGPASNITGYFTSIDPASLWHFPTPTWTFLAEDNTWFDRAGFWGYPFIPGGYDWVIPVQWKVVGSSVTNSFPSWTQSMRILNSGGLSTVTKLGATASRMPPPRP